MPCTKLAFDSTASHTIFTLWVDPELDSFKVPLICSEGPVMAEGMYAIVKQGA